MLYEIINPSDEYHFEAPDLELAAIALLVLGEGHYAGRADEEGGTDIPLFMLGNNPDDWFKKHFNKTFGESLEGIMKSKARKSELADALDSVIIGSLNERKELAESLKEITDEKEKEKYKKQWSDKRRSSMNNIGKRAKLLADATRKIKDE